MLDLYFPASNFGPGLVWLGVLRQCRFQVLGNTNVVHYQARRLVTEYAVNASDSLHQAVAAHRRLVAGCDAHLWGARFL